MKLNVIEERTVGPELGKDSIQKGVIASIVATLARDPLHADHLWPVRRLRDRSALIVNALLILGIMAMFNATLTLPGIAGFVLTIGAAVDANVLINERIREEQRRGRKMLDALETGYKEASTAIFDANITNVIAAVLMYVFRLRPDPRLRRRADDRHRHLGLHRGQLHPDAGRRCGCSASGRANCISDGTAT